MTGRFTVTWSVRALTFALGSVVVASPAGAQTFSSRVEAVRVDVLVTDGGQRVTGLRAEDFEVRDNGVSQDVDLVAFEQLPLDLVLAFDVSASVTGARLEHLQGAGLTLLEHLKGDDRVALLTFSEAVQLREGLTGNLERVGRALAAVVPEGDTALIDGTFAAVTLGAGDAGRGLLILFSDGVDTASWLSPGSVLDAARRSDVVVYGVAERRKEGGTFLRDLTALTGGDLVEIDSTRDLSGTFLRVLDEFRSRYVLSYSPKGVAGGGWHRLEVRVKDRRATVRARAGYQAGG